MKGGGDFICTPQIVLSLAPLCAFPPAIRFCDPITIAWGANVHILTTFIAGQPVKDRAEMVEHQPWGIHTIPLLQGDIQRGAIWEYPRTFPNEQMNGQSGVAVDGT